MGETHDAASVIKKTTIEPCDLQSHTSARQSASHNRWSLLSECGINTVFYLRTAQAYMLISMPTGTSTIFGVFQAILDLLPHVMAVFRLWRG